MIGRRAEEIIAKQKAAKSLRERMPNRNEDAPRPEPQGGGFTGGYFLADSNGQDAPGGLIGVLYPTRTPDQA